MTHWGSTPWELCTQTPHMPATRDAEVQWEWQGDGVSRGSSYPDLHFPSSYRMSRETPHLWSQLPHQGSEQPGLAAPYVSSHGIV